MGRLVPCVILCRPQNMAITFVSVVVAGILAGSLRAPSNLYLAAMAAALIAGGANALNDFFDRDIDRINKPHRPLPSGRTRPGAAVATAVALFAVGLILSLIPGLWTFLIAVFAVSSLTLYSYRLKRRPVSGNIVVAGLGACAFIYGGVAVGRPEGAIIPALFALLYHFGREVTKDIEDEAADRAVGASTIPIRFGRDRASLVARISFLLLILLTPLPFILNLYGYLYLICVIPTVDLILVVVIAGVGPRATVRRISRLNGLLKVGMVLGLACLYLGRF